MFDEFDFDEGDKITFMNGEIFKNGRPVYSRRDGIDWVNPSLNSIVSS